MIAALRSALAAAKRLTRLHPWADNRAVSDDQTPAPNPDAPPGGGTATPVPAAGGTEPTPAADPGLAAALRAALAANNPDIPAAAIAGETLADIQGSIAAARVIADHAKAQAAAPAPSAPATPPAPAAPPATPAPARSDNNAVTGLRALDRIRAGLATRS